MSDQIQQVLTEIKTGVASFDDRFRALERRMDSWDMKQIPVPSGANGRHQDGIDFFMKQLSDSRGEFDRMRRLVFKTPSLLQTKATITSTGLYAPAAAMAVAGGGRFPYTLREVFSSVNADAGSVFNARSTVESTSPVSQANEGDTKAESSYTLTGDTISIPTIAHYVNVSRQAMDDVIGLGAFLRTTLLWGLARELERQMIDGDGSNGEMSGLMVTGEAFDTSILTAADGYEIADLIAAAACQLRESGFSADFFVVNPRTWLKAILTKDSMGNYVIGAPQSAAEEQLWQMRAVVSDQIGSSYFLVGDSSAAVLRTRMDATIDVSDSHSDNFTRNKVTIRAEERAVLQKMRPDAFVWGTTTTSPA